jgi:hypothetical protein
MTHPVEGTNLLETRVLTQVSEATHLAVSSSHLFIRHHPTTCWAKRHLGQIPNNKPVQVKSSGFIIKIAASTLYRLHMATAHVYPFLGIGTNFRSA